MNQKLEKGGLDLSIDGRTVGEQLAVVLAGVDDIMVDLYECYHSQLLPALAEQGIVIADYASLDERERAAVDSYYAETIYPVLTPLAVDPAPLALGGSAPDALALAVGQGMLEAGLAYRAFRADGLGLPRVVLVGRRVENLGVDALASSELAPTGGRRGGHQGHFLKHSVRSWSLSWCSVPFPHP